MTSSSVGARRRRGRGDGSPTSASDAVDAPAIAHDDSPDALLDLAVQYTFPASDPIAVESAYARRRRNKK
jgi:hypothetical protein